MSDAAQLKVVATAITPHTEAVYEAGKKILVDSVEVGRDFCKFMIGVCTGAIPIYLTLVGLSAGRDFRPSLGQGLLLLVPATGFLAAAGVFAAGYFPVTSSFSLEVVDEIESARASIVNRRYERARLGFYVFLAAAAAATLMAIYGLQLSGSRH